MAIIPQLDRLQAQLLTSGLSQKNSSLYQVIDQLIKLLRQGMNEVEGQIITITSSPPAPTPGTTIISGMPLGAISDDNENTDWNWGPPGPQGLQGVSGTPGIPGMDGEDCECEPIFIIGTQLYP
jgi:hypothetical protein